MTTTFKGNKIGFNPSGSNDCVPNEMGAPTTKFGGRPAVPAGPLKRYPGAVADIDGGNRRLAKSRHGSGEGDGVNWTGSPNGFKPERGSKSGGSPKGDGQGRGAMKMNKK